MGVREGVLAHTTRTTQRGERPTRPRPAKRVERTPEPKGVSQLERRRRHPYAIGSRDAVDSSDAPGLSVGAPPVGQCWWEVSDGIARTPEPGTPMGTWRM
jgi:hypothetical protein